jgi:major membrane immunogen (membrane-anchored lipoprotein)
MGGLAKICKMYGSMEVVQDGKKVIWIYDYANDKPRLKSEMTKEEIKASEKSKWMKIRESSDRL